MSQNPTESLSFLANFLSGRITLYCTRCREYRRLSVENRGIRLPAPEASSASYVAAPRVRLWCNYCQRVLGYVTPDGMEPAEQEAASGRWNHLELDENNAAESSR